MGKGRKCLLGCISIGLIFLTSCSMPRIIVYDDPLSAKEHNDLAVAYQKKEDLDLAEKEYKKAIARDRNWDIPYFNLGNLYYQKKDYKKAEEYYKKAISINPKNSDALNNLAYLLYLEGRYKEAWEYIQKALKIKQKPEYIDTYNKIKEKIEQN